MKLDGMVQMRKNAKKDGVRRTPGRAKRIMQQRRALRMLSVCFMRGDSLRARHSGRNASRGGRSRTISTFAGRVTPRLLDRASMTKPFV
ncbi:MAG TPA: hypothetical protein VJU59_18840 [Paraburkholderia sp.]|uniref:hypothetical protein n=1 Tax=Paraburkholderia sp. TaxID=1926495 RepID=UPI002B46E203|nr:hypothetical protein [Paraburkholderia sp.]HKR41699.1 hypothetical protein [Paraburkholderia sp.]